MKKNIKVTWSAFGGNSFVEFALDTHDPALRICDRVFGDTNRYEGSLWDIIEPLLWNDRTHTALSVGDVVEVDGQAFRCASIGWTPLCDWLVQVPSNNPEPDQPSDLYNIVPCHGEVEPIVRDGVEVGWRCSNGHEWVSEEHKTKTERYEEFLADKEGAF